MIHASRSVLFLCFGIASLLAPSAFAFRKQKATSVAATLEAADDAGRDLSDEEIAQIFRSAAKKTGKVGKMGKSGKSGKGQGGIMGFIQKQAIKMAANRVFTQFDKDRNGHLDAQELNAAISKVTRIIGISPSQSMIYTAMQMFDCDSSGTLDKYEFYLMCMQLHYLVGGGTGKHYKLANVALNGCRGHMAHGYGYGHGAGYAPGYRPGPGYGANPGYAPGYNPGYGPNPGYGHNPGYGPGGANHGYAHNPGMGYGPGGPRY